MSESAFYRRLSHHTTLGEAEAELLSGVLTGDARFEAGEVIVQRGEPASYAFVVAEGWAARTISLSDGRTQIVNFMLPGDAFDLQVFVGLPTDHTVRALTSVRVATIARPDLIAAVEGGSRLAGALWWAGVQEEAILREQVVRNGRRSARERVAHLFLELHERLRVIGQADGDSFSLPIGQASLADALGLSYVHVSRVLTHLERAGLIERARSRVTLRDRKALETLCDFSTLYLRGAAGPLSLG